MVTAEFLVQNGGFIATKTIRGYAMTQISQFMQEMVQAEQADAEQAEEHISNAVASLDDRDSFSINATVFNTESGTISESEEFWNDSVHYSTVETAMMGTELELEIIRLTDQNRMYITVEDATMIEDSNTYLYGTPDEFETIGFKVPESDVSEDEVTKNLILGSDVSVSEEDSTALFVKDMLMDEIPEGIADLEFDSVYSVVRYDLDEEEVRTRYMSCRNPDGTVEEHVDEFVYDTGASFPLPSTQSEDVKDISKMRESKAITSLLLRELIDE